MSTIISLFSWFGVDHTVKRGRAFVFRNKRASGVEYSAWVGWHESRFCVSLQGNFEGGKKMGRRRAVKCEIRLQM